MHVRNSIEQIIKFLVPILLIMITVNGCGSDDSTSPTDSENGPNFDSGLLAPGDTFSFTFEEEGTVDYYCSTHEPDMTGQVIVSQGAEISGQDTVVMENTRFNPSQITIAPNTEIVWVNGEDETVDDHTVTSGTPSGDGGVDGY